MMFHVKSRQMILGNVQPFSIRIRIKIDVLIDVLFNVLRSPFIPFFFSLRTRIDRISICCSPIKCDYKNKHRQFSCSGNI